MVLFRADANEIIGIGHIMRCLSIAQAIAETGEAVVFITADHKADLLISERGFKTVCLGNEFNNLDAELPDLIAYLDDVNPELLIIDSYYVTKTYFENISPHVKIAYIDDMNIDVWDVDYLINYNIFSETFDYSEYDNTRANLLIGPKYAPLREEFKSVSRFIVKDKVENVMISAGGSDPFNFSEKFMRQVCPECPDITFHFIIGALNPRLKEIKKLEHNNIVLHINEQHMSKLMQQSDIAIAAAGSTLYELSACGVPTVTFSLADNQMVATEQFERQGVMLSAGDCRYDSCFFNKMCVEMKKLIRDKSLREKLSAKMKQLVDGQGAVRLAKILLNDVD